MTQPPSPLTLLLSRHTKRREFILALGGAAAWPLSARAQQAGKLPTVGFLGTTTPSIMSQWTAAFVGRLRELGWIEGRTIKIEYRWDGGRPERSAEIAAEFVRLKVDDDTREGVYSLAYGSARLLKSPRQFWTRDYLTGKGRVLGWLSAS
jgi:hypothetical protein